MFVRKGWVDTSDFFSLERRIRANDVMNETKASDPNQIEDEAIPGTNLNTGKGHF
jgi:hypothetical protein